MLEIESKTIISFLKKVRMDGKHNIEECLLRFEPDGLKINANTQTKQSRVTAHLLATAFKNYEAIGEVGLNDFSTIVNVLGRFKDVVSIEKKGNLLTVSQGKKSVHVELVSPQFIEDASKGLDLEFTDNFNIEARVLNDIYKDVLMNKDAMINIKAKGQKVLFTNTGKYKFFNEFDAPFHKGELDIKFGEPLINATTHLDGTLKFELKNEYPGQVTEETEVSVITVIVSPITEG